MGNTAAANDKGNYLLMFFDYNTLNLSHRIKNHASWKMQNFRLSEFQKFGPPPPKPTVQKKVGYGAPCS